MTNEKEGSASGSKKKVKDVSTSIGLLGKINLIRHAWSQEQTDKEGQGKAGGNSKYDYYKPQQIIDFCLKKELEHGIYSKFTTHEDRCSYSVIDVDTGEIESVECLFDIPRKMAASQAQQVGAALTYFSRRLAMLMYKIDDNSKENVDVMEDADYSTTTSSFIPIAPVNVVVPSTPIAPTQQVAPPVPPTPTEPKEDKVVQEVQCDTPEVKIATPAPPVPSREVYIPPTSTISGVSKQKPTPVTPRMSPSDVMSSVYKKAPGDDPEKPSIESMYE